MKIEIDLDKVKENILKLTSEGFDKVINKLFSDERDTVKIEQKENHKKH